MRIPLLPPPPAPPGFPLAAGQILFISTRDGAPEVYQMGRTGEDQTRVTTAFGAVADPTLSREGKLSYSAIASDHWEIFAGGVDAPPAQLTRDSGEAREPRWLPDGSVVYISARAGDDDIWQRKPSGELTNLTSASPGPDLNPAPSPDGRQIAYASRRAGAFEIFVLTLATRAVTQLTHGGGQNGHPSWSPDGRRIAFDRVGASGSDIWTMTQSGDDPRRVVATDADEFHPSYAPAPVDGRARFVYVSNANGNYEIWLANDDGTGSLNLTQSPGGADISPFWASAPIVPYQLTLQPAEVTGAGGGPNSPVACTVSKAVKGKIVGTKKADVICGTNKADKIYGKGGRDVIYPRRGKDAVFGGLGDDTIFARIGGADTVDGGKGVDVAYVDKADLFAGGARAGEMSVRGKRRPRPAVTPPARDPSTESTLDRDIERSQSEPRADLPRLLWASTRLLVAFVAGAAALGVTAFQLRDRLFPPVTVYGGEVVAADIVSVGTTYQAYVHYRDYLFSDPDAAIVKAGDLANAPGVVVNVVLRLQGLRGRACSVTATVYRVPLIRVRPPERTLDKCGAHVQDGDQGGWPAWVRLPQRPGRYFIRFDLYDDVLLLGPGKATPAFVWDGEG